MNKIRTELHIKNVEGVALVNHEDFQWITERNHDGDEKFLVTDAQKHAFEDAVLDQVPSRQWSNVQRICMLLNECKWDSYIM